MGWRIERFQKLPVVPETLSIGTVIYQIQPVPLGPVSSEKPGKNEWPAKVSGQEAVWTADER